MFAALALQEIERSFGDVWMSGCGTWLFCATLLFGYSIDNSFNNRFL